MPNKILIVAVTQTSAFEKEKIFMQSKCRRKIYEISVENDQMNKLMSSAIRYKKTDSTTSTTNGHSNGQTSTTRGHTYTTSGLT